MHLAYVIALFLPITALGVSQDAKCCYRDQLSGVAYRDGEKMFEFNADYSRERIVGIWSDSFAFEVDLKTNTMYRWFSNDICRSTTSFMMLFEELEQCVPEDADIVTEYAEEAQYSFEAEGNVQVLKTVRKTPDGKCLPVQTVLSQGQWDVTLT